MDDDNISVNFDLDKIEENHRRLVEQCQLDQTVDELEKTDELDESTFKQDIVYLNKDEYECEVGTYHQPLDSRLNHVALFDDSSDDDDCDWWGAYERSHNDDFADDFADEIRGDIESVNGQLKSIGEDVAESVAYGFNILDEINALVMSNRRIEKMLSRMEKRIENIEREQRCAKTGI